MKQLQAIIPIYIDNIGNAVKLYFNDNFIITERTFYFERIKILFILN